MNQFKTRAQVEMPLGQIPGWIRQFSNCFLATEVTESTENCAGQMPESDTYLCERCALGGEIPPTITSNQFKTDAQVEMPLGQVARWIGHISSSFLATEVTESTEDCVEQMPEPDTSLCERCVLGGKFHRRQP
ncbi:hypothetical protein [Rhodopirellula sp. P2]|uniref:hypothetical protein n=1 Tax=Rhodopirellula sp. P2 TaxID=2127060 RepID=UPI00236773D2|nr:hypothetical protein [Rhodopirellula sp. P2]WDQ14654.1 hypothetical protein PSR62_13470 [Rhodopirellula sp. P2]